MGSSRSFPKFRVAPMGDGAGRKGALRATCVLLAVAIVLTAYSRDNRFLGRGGTSLLGEFLAPIHGSASRLWSPAKDLFRDYLVSVDTRRDTRHLKQRIAALKTRILALEEQERENERLKGILRVQPRERYRSILANVISHDVANRVFGVTIDKGRRDGIQPHSAVVNGEGVVGVVSAVMSSSAKVLLLVDPRSGVDVRTSDSRSVGVVKGFGRRGLELNFVVNTKKVHTGEAVLTSGLDDIFPAGLLVGHIQKVAKGERALFRRVQVRPAADFERLEELLVVVSDTSARTSEQGGGRMIFVARRCKESYGR